MAKGETYEEFVAKFSADAPKTTDDCYTPQAVYEAVKEYALKLAGLCETTCTPVRPFYPGGDYKNYDYPADTYVIDNPPFSILAEIRKFYIDKGIKYFLFAPNMHIMNNMSTCRDMCILTGVTITYDNGAKIPTSFVTNVLCEDILLRTAPELVTALRRTIARTQGNLHNSLKVQNEYPRNLFCFQKLQAVRYADFSIRRSECRPVCKLKLKTECNTATRIKRGGENLGHLYGHFGLIIPDSVADRYERAAASVPKDAGKNVYYFTEEQEEIIAELNKQQQCENP